MKAVRTVESNFTFRGPTPEVADLPGRVEPEQRRFFAIFEFTDEERTMIANGAQLKLGIWQLPMPPVSVSVVKVELAAGVEQDGVPVSPDWRCRLCDNLYVNDRAIALEFKCGHCGGELRLPGAAE